MGDKIDFPNIKKMREEIEKLLKERPELREYQKQIDDELKKAGANPHNRMAVFRNLMVEQQKKMKDALLDLKSELTKMQEAKRIVAAEEAKKNIKH